MFVIMCSSDGKILQVGQEFLNLLGRSLDDVLGRTLDDFRATGNNLKDVAARRDDRVYLRNAEGRAVEVWLREAMLGDGEMKALVGEEMEIRTLDIEMLPGWKSLDTIEVAVLTESHDGLIAYANTKLLAMLEYERKDLFNNHWSLIIPHEERRWVERHLQNRLKGEIGQYETVIVTRNGRRIPVIVNARPIMQSGEYLGSIETFTDITDRKQAEYEARTKSDRLEQLNQALNDQRARLLGLTEELAQANDQLKKLSQTKSEFVASVSHDLRTPLTTIIEGVCLVEDGTLGEINEEQKKFLKLAVEDAERLKDMINDILDVAKIEAGKIVPAPVRVNTTELCARTKLTSANYMREKGLTLAFEPADVPPVFCDKQHYERVLTNLLSNAIKFTPIGGTITIRVTIDEPGRVRTSVKDTGIGIPEEQKHIIFGKFEQVKRVGAQKQTGSGLGLSLCWHLVNLNHGRIAFESEEQKGSDFYFVLPAYDPRDDVAQILRTAGAHARSVSGQLVTIMVQTPAVPALDKIAEAVRRRITVHDQVRIIPELQAVVIACALPKASSKATISDLAEKILKLGLPEVRISSLTLAEDDPDPQVLLAELDHRLKPLVAEQPDGADA